MKPVAQGYRYVVHLRPRPRQRLPRQPEVPLYLGNDLLQGNVGNAGITLSRFALNTTFGVLGIMDVANPMGLPGHQSDFGQTLGVWGVGEGPYLVLPLFGPSNPRDTTGIALKSLPPTRWITISKTSI